MRNKQNEKNDDFLVIDELRLDEEWVNQPRLFFKYAVSMADARQIMDKAKVMVDVVKADLDRAIRSDPCAFHVTKVTVDSIASAIVSSGPYKGAHDDLINRRHEYEMIKAAVDALEQRKSALEKLVSLQGQNYFSKPEAPQEAKEAMEEVTKKKIRSRSTRKQD